MAVTPSGNCASERLGARLRVVLWLIFGTERRAVRVGTAARTFSHNFPSLALELLVTRVRFRHLRVVFLRPQGVLVVVRTLSVVAELFIRNSRFIRLVVQSSAFREPPRASPGNRGVAK